MIPYPPLHADKAGFAGIRRRKGLYVDKTPFLRRLLATDPVGDALNDPPTLLDSHLFLARPRRFGKSLLIDTLETWFQGLPPHRTAQLPSSVRNTLDVPDGWSSPAWLWEGLDGEAWHGHHGWHPVIRLDMSKLTVNDPAEMHRDLKGYLLHQVSTWRLHGVSSDLYMGNPHQEGDSPALILLKLIKALVDFYERQPVVLVDEYDAPVTRHMGTDRTPAAAVELLRDFYRVLKDDDDMLYGVFLTGITRFAREHLFSAANNIMDISDWAPYAALCGFTETEVVRDLEPHRQALVALEPRFREAAMLRDWRDWFNGYRFAPFPSAEQVYNPFTLLRGLTRVLGDPDTRNLAVAGHWPSAWSESGHPGLATRLAADTQQDRPGTVWEGGRPPLPASGPVDLARPDYSRLMLDTGYYTWCGMEEGGIPYLNFPNREVASSWVRDILHLWARTPYEEKNLVANLRACLAQGDVSGFARSLETFAFSLAGENLRSEAAFRILLQALFLLMGQPTLSEKSTPGGRSDHEIMVGNRIYVFEVKDNRPATEGIRQIRDRPYGREHLETDSIVTAVALAFRRDRKQGARLECKYADLRDLLQEQDDTSGETAQGTKDAYNSSIL